MANKRIGLERDEKDYESYLAEARDLIDSKLSNLSLRISDLRLVKKIGYVHLYQSSKLVEKKRLLENLRNFTIFKQSDKQLFWKEIRVKLKDNGSIDYCCGKIDAYLVKSTEQLKLLRDNCFKSYLYSMAESLKPMPANFSSL